MTNRERLLERLRTMPVEDLARIVKVELCPPLEEGLYPEQNCERVSCGTCWLNWLKEGE